MRTDRGRQRFYAAGWLVSVAVMAVAGRMWQLHLHEVEQRAEEAERSRDELARRRAMEERLRIARELHDSLTHSISVIQVQAGVAEHLARKRGEDVPPALAAIQEAGTDAARELRATLRVLRSTDEADSSGLGQLDNLVARARAAGLPVTVMAARAAPGWDCSACGSGCPCSAAACTPGRRTTAASGSGPNCRSGPCRDQNPAGRRSAADPQRHPGPAGGRGRHRGGR
jgi:hypothetical protein